MAAGLTLAGCSDDGDGTDAGPGSGDGSGGEHAVETDATLGKVRGELDDARAAEALAAVTEVVDGWIDGGYAGDYPRGTFDEAFGAFTDDARELALAQPAVMSNAEVGDRLEGAEVTQRSVSVDVLGVRGKPAGATAHVVLTVELEGGPDGTQRSDQVTGRLLLTPGKDGWRVFGFDVSRGEEGA
ncbi:hypothetical protein RB608_27930 [Nocardioides sp. LHD-245]|uniref:hypothetical protein n=1 Tax=Nocardioides sp. LHD-245 TaxID=3051387 RepID=UPI0027E0E656|nr:hypothetical protein [Nocardioides sp. LHD-245]